ncbi:MAG: NAD(+) synthase [Candidatus Omnitrophota bacterium]
MTQQRVLPERNVDKIYEQLVAGTREYMKRHNFKKIVLGLSGGVDSAVTCAIAAAAAGPENVLGISMPSEYSSKESVSLAEDLSENLRIKLKTISIKGIYDSYLDTLEKYLKEDKFSDVEVYHQNIQARIRGNIVMAFSNRYGHLVLATGNRSEAMMGYCTLYGDTVGGLAVISDIFKTEVYRVAEYINRNGEIIPRGTIEKAPSAELKPGQKDEDSLPPYDILDVILYLLLDEKVPHAELVKMGFDPAIVDNVTGAIKSSEYKRKQCPAGIYTDRVIGPRF